MKQVGLFKNENVPVPLLPLETGHWEYITSNFDRTKKFTKIRCTTANIIIDIYYSSLPNINADGKSRGSVLGASWGYAGLMGFGYYINYINVPYPADGDWTNHDLTWNATNIANIGTYVGVGQDGYAEYEIDMNAPFYWAGYSSTSGYNYPYHFSVYVVG